MVPIKPIGPGVTTINRNGGEPENRSTKLMFQASLEQDYGTIRQTNADWNHP